LLEVVAKRSFVGECVPKLALGDGGKIEWTQWGSGWGSRIGSIDWRVWGVSRW